MKVLCLGQSPWSFTTLQGSSAALLGQTLRRCDTALRASEGAEHVYVLLLGDHVPHLHLHVAPRYPGTPREYWGTRVDEWPDAPQVSEQEIKRSSGRFVYRGYHISREGPVGAPGRVQALPCLLLSRQRPAVAAEAPALAAKAHMSPT